MEKYGEVIDQDYNPIRDAIYPLFVQYFGNPLMSKSKDIDDYSMYICKIDALLGIEYRYIIAFVYHDKILPGTQIRLSKLPWLSLQTRTLKDEHNLPPHSYVPRRLSNLDKKIVLTYKDSEQYVYKAEGLPIIVTLLPKDSTKSKSMMEYNNTGTIVNALETYQTIISFE